MILRLVDMGTEKEGLCVRTTALCVGVVSGELTESVS